MGRSEPLPNRRACKRPGSAVDSAARSTPSPILSTDSGAGRRPRTAATRVPRCGRRLTARPVRQPSGRPSRIVLAGPAPPWLLCASAGPHGPELALPGQCFRIQQMLSLVGLVKETISHDLADRDSTKHFRGLIDRRLLIAIGASNSKRTPSRADKAGELDTLGMRAVAVTDRHVIGKALAIGDQCAEKTGWRACTVHDWSRLVNFDRAAGG